MNCFRLCAMSETKSYSRILFFFFPSLKYIHPTDIPEKASEEEYGRATCRERS